ncbi:hypothetical protein MP228_005622 [Amoeboaphelidium protococcarum]|nr:hypothetical protein MP228_005622 [Amoeboaphelidium protococcarum]
MCGRTAMFLRLQDLDRVLNQRLNARNNNNNIRNKEVSNNDNESGNQSKYRESYNVAPTRYQPVIRACNSDGYDLEFMHWGMELFKGRNIVNSRFDSIVAGTNQKYIKMRHQRCVVVCNGFYEWQGKQPYYFHAPKTTIDQNTEVDGVVLLAAMYDSDDHYTIITTDSLDTKQSGHNLQLINELHDRIPIILCNTQMIKMWLHEDWESVKQIDQIMKVHLSIITEDSSPVKAEQEGSDLDKKPSEGRLTLLRTKVSPFVGKVGNDSPLCIQSYDDSFDYSRTSSPVKRRDKRITDYFASPSKKQKSSPLNTKNIKKDE